MPDMPVSKKTTEGARASAPIVELRDVRLSLPSQAGLVNILRGITLDIRPGSHVGITGPSGSGKSTLMMVMAGLERPSSGAVNVAGHDLTQMDEDSLALFRRDHVGIVFQGFHLVPTMTALENVTVPLELSAHRDAFDRAETALGRVGLAHRLGHYPAQLSGGEQQRVAVARALSVEPGLLLADEPTGNLDGETGAQIMDLLFELSAEVGTTLVLITHDQALAARCDHLVGLVDGRLALAPGIDGGAP